MAHLLFVYGTLLQPGNEFGRYLAKHSRYFKSGKIKGNLYDIGAYPGLLINGGASDWVYGDIYEVDNGTLKLIDDYEGYGPQQAQPNLYIRTLKAVQTARGETDAWVYLYNLPVNGLQKIRSGNYLEYIKQKNPPDYEPGDL